MQMETASPKTSSAIVRRENRGTRRKSVKVKIQKKTAKVQSRENSTRERYNESAQAKKRASSSGFCQVKLLNFVTNHMDIFERIVYCNYRYAKREIT